MPNPNPPLPDGYYALPDPDNPTTMTYWRAADGLLAFWPTKAWYGPAKLLKRDAPADRDEYIAWLRAWFEHHQAWQRRAQAAIEEAPDACRARFAAFTTRCCDCGRPFTDAKSKTLGIGPDCRSGYDEAWLAATLTPAMLTASPIPTVSAESSRRSLPSSPPSASRPPNPARPGHLGSPRLSRLRDHPEPLHLRTASSTPTTGRDRNGFGATLCTM